MTALAALALAFLLALPGLSAPKRGKGAPAAKKDTTAPVMEHTPVGEHDGKGPVLITVKITDESAIYEPTLVVRMATSSSPFTRVPLLKIDPAQPDIYSAEVPVALLSGDVEYLVEAFDENGNGPSRVGDEAAPLKITRAAAVTPPPLDGGGDKTTEPVKPVEEDNTGLIIGGIVVGSIVVVGAAAGIGFAVYALRPPAPDVVRINVVAPAPIAAAAAAAAVAVPVAGAP